MPIHRSVGRPRGPRPHRAFKLDETFYRIFKTWNHTLKTFARNEGWMESFTFADIRRVLTGGPCTMEERDFFAQEIWNYGRDHDMPQWELLAPDEDAMAKELERRDNKARAIKAQMNYFKDQVHKRTEEVTQRVEDDSFLAKRTQIYIEQRDKAYEAGIEEIGYDAFEQQARDITAGALRREDAHPFYTRFAPGTEPKLGGQ